MCQVELNKGTDKEKRHIEKSQTTQQDWKWVYNITSILLPCSEIQFSERTSI